MVKLIFIHITPYCAIHVFEFVQKYSKIFLIILEYFLILQKMVQCMSKDFLFTIIPDVADIGNSRDPPDLKTMDKYLLHD